MSLRYLSTSLSNVLRRNNVRPDGSIIPCPTAGILTGLRYKHYLNLLPYSRNIARRQSGMKYSDQVWNDNLQHLL